MSDVLYDVIEYIFVGLIMLIGLIMYLFPKQSTKKALRDSEEAVGKNKRNGLILAIMGAVALAVLVIGKSSMK